MQYNEEIQYSGGYIGYRGGYFEYSGGYFEYSGVILSTMGSILSTKGSILSTKGDFQYSGFMMITVRIILNKAGMFSTVERYHNQYGGYRDACGKYHEYSEGVQYNGVFNETTKERNCLS